MITALASAIIPNLTAANLNTLTFFSLLRYGECASERTDTTPFNLDLQTALDADLLSATFASLNFTTQRNATRGNVIVSLA
jgi:hypothetical protein